MAKGDPKSVRSDQKLAVALAIVNFLVSREGRDPETRTGIIQPANLTHKAQDAEVDEATFGRLVENYEKRPAQFKHPLQIAREFTKLWERAVRKLLPLPVPPESFQDWLGKRNLSFLEGPKFSGIVAQPCEPFPVSSMASRKGEITITRLENVLALSRDQGFKSALLSNEQEENLAREIADSPYVVLDSIEHALALSRWYFENLYSIWPAVRSRAQSYLELSKFGKSSRSRGKQPQVKLSPQATRSLTSSLADTIRCMRREVSRLTTQYGIISDADSRTQFWAECLAFSKHISGWYESMVQFGKVSPDQLFASACFENKKADSDKDVALKILSKWLGLSPSAVEKLRNKPGKAIHGGRKKFSG